ncbi:MAG: hypothetical protein P4N41_08535 [Negativicutes bacterium]|nr:hypothetical protein [Negativicutes bacterium]
MIINTISTLALYCSRCGKIQMHDVSRFDLKNAVGRELACTCSQKQAVITGTGHGQYLLDVPCIVCETNHIICVDIKDFWRGKVNKIYCPMANLELGFSGNRRAIEQTIAEHQREFDSIAREVAHDDYIENPQIMFEVLNKIHDIAESGGVCCHCGGGLIEADVQPAFVELVCMHCDGRRVIPAKTEADLLQLHDLVTIELGPGRRSRHRR